MKSTFIAAVTALAGTAVAAMLPTEYIPRAESAEFTAEYISEEHSAENASAENLWAFKYPATPYEFDNGLNIYQWSPNSTETGIERRDDPPVRDVHYADGVLAISGYLSFITYTHYELWAQECIAKKQGVACVFASIHSLLAVVTGGAIYYKYHYVITGLILGTKQLVNKIRNPIQGRDNLLDARSQPCPNDNQAYYIWDGHYDNPNYGVKAFCEPMVGLCEGSSPDPSKVDKLLGNLAFDMIKYSAARAQFTLYYTDTKVVLYRCGVVMEIVASNTCPETITGGLGCTYQGKD